MATKLKDLLPEDIRESAKAAKRIIESTGVPSEEEMARLRILSENVALRIADLLEDEDK